MILSYKVMKGEVPKLCLLVATLALGTVSGGGACERGVSWWDREHGACVPCTRCDPRKQAVKIPCELHRDTICQALNEVRIWPFNTPKRNDSVNKYGNDYEYYETEYVDYESDVRNSDGEVKWDLQTSTLTLAATGCVVFFVVVLSVSMYHAKQWKVLKRALMSDVRDMSAKLKLMEAGVETPCERVVPTDHHIYCNIHVAKDGFVGSSGAKKGFGNVYTQEKQPN